MKQDYSTPKCVTVTVMVGHVLCGSANDPFSTTPIEDMDYCNDW